MSQKKDENGLEFWLHRDQKFDNTCAADCIQGCFSLTNISDSDYSTVIMEPNNINPQELCDLFYETFKYGDHKKTHDDNWYVFTPEQRKWLSETAHVLKQN